MKSTESIDSGTSSLYLQIHSISTWKKAEGLIILSQKIKLWHANPEPAYIYVFVCFCFIFILR